MYVCDISECGTVRVAGADAERFLTTMYSGDMGQCQSLGEMSDGLLLNSLGEIIDAVQIFRTGQTEYLMLTSGENTDEVVEWLNAHAELSDDAGKLFEDLVVQDQSEHMAVLVMYGSGAKRTHDELCEACKGKIAIFTYECKRACYRLPDPVAYVLFAPVNAAASIGDFLVDSKDVEVVDYDRYCKLLEEQGHYEPKLHDAAYVKPSEIGMNSLLRDGGGFVGAKALGI